jgi:HSP20 family protein
MTLVRLRNPEKWDTMFPAMSTMMKSFWDDFNEADSTNFFNPRADVVEKDGSFEVQMALPGMEREAIKVDVKDRTVVISGERKFKNEEKNAKYHKVETQYGSFTRSFNLPENVNAEGIEAEFKNGILHINIPKSPERAAKTINIK